MARRLCGLLRPLSVSVSASASASARTPQIRQISHRVWSPALCSPAATVRTAGVQMLSQTPRSSILQRVSSLVPSLTQQPCRTLTYFSLKKGKRKSIKSVTDRFMRLHCGLWIRRKAGYKKKLWKKMPARKKRLREIVFCNKTQSKLLDKMTTSFWRRRNWYVNDPYLKYHDRTNLKL